MDDLHPFILILGMHRSGTSCLTGSLEHCGLYLGEVRRKGGYNVKGNFELPTIQKLHDQILHHNKGSWSSPPQSIRVHPLLHQQLKFAIDTLRHHKPCGIKDPRTLLMLETWKEIVGEDSQLIGTFRHPMAVAKSLSARSRLPIEHCLELWIHYNGLLAKEHRIRPFPLIHFDLSRPKEYLDNIISMAKELGLKPQKRRLSSFISPELDHYQFDAKDIPTSCKEMYQYLVKQQNYN